MTVWLKNINLHEKKISDKVKNYEIVVDGEINLSVVDTLEICPKKKVTMVNEKDCIVNIQDLPPDLIKEIESVYYKIKKYITNKEGV